MDPRLPLQNETQETDSSVPRTGTPSMGLIQTHLYSSLTAPPSPLLLPAALQPLPFSVETNPLPPVSLIPPLLLPYPAPPSVRTTPLLQPSLPERISAPPSQPAPPSDTSDAVLLPPSSQFSRLPSSSNAPSPPSSSQSSPLPAPSPPDLPPQSSQPHPPPFTLSSQPLPSPSPSQPSPPSSSAQPPPLLSSSQCSPLPSLPQSIPPATLPPGPPPSSSQPHPLPSLSQPRPSSSTSQHSPPSSSPQRPPLTPSSSQSRPLLASSQPLESGVSPRERENTVRSERAYEVCCAMLIEMDPKYRKRYFSDPVSPDRKERSTKIRKLLLLATKGSASRVLSSRGMEFSSVSARTDEQQCTTLARRIRESERRARASYELYKSLFPSEIWHCCPSTCFALITTRVEVVHTLANICRTAKQLRAEIDEVAQLVESRRRGVGGSHMAFNAQSRTQRETEDGCIGNDRQVARYKLAEYVESVIPFLYNHGEVELSGVQLPRKLCTEAICRLLGVSRNFLFRRKKPGARSDPSIGVPTSLIDKAGARLKQLRRTGDRRGFPAISEMKEYKCGCVEPCFANVPEWRLQRQYKSFLDVSMRESPRRMEHQFLLDIMFCPLSNSTVRQCDRAIAKLFTVSEGVVVAVRRNLNRMCNDPALDDRPLQAGWKERGYSSPNHPANRMDDETRERIENHLNMVLRPDPAGADEISVCRVYSTEVNTHEKLRKFLINLLKDDDSGPLRISSSTLQRRINEYLETRKLRISFQQTDHNACPHCKTFKHASFRYHKEHKLLQAKLEVLVRQNDGNDPQRQACLQRVIEALRIEVQTKKEQEDETIANFSAHCRRDRDIRKVIKTVSDLFRNVENELIRKRVFAESSPPWNYLAEHGIITHQDDMTKIDLPYFVESASADITRWRFGVNAHVSAVNGDAVVFSHEQGSGPKNGACIVEEILLDHVIRCRGEAIKIIVSDNASVGKNWLCTVSLPQYIVDQGLAKVVLIIFLENNHGKWLADLLFGQLQTRRKRTTLLSVDDLLSEFESINRSRGFVQGFALNPLSSIDFARVLESLGYETKPPTDFNFTKRNIHSAGAAARGAKDELNGTLKKILSNALPDDPGMVRICSNPPCDTPLCRRRYEDRYFDVPAARISESTSTEVSHTAQAVCGTSVASALADSNENAQSFTMTQQTSEPNSPPLVVALNQTFSLSGNGVVSHRTADHVGFNGLGFRKLPAFPELREDGTDVVGRAWPPGLVTRGWNQGESGEPQFGTEVVKCSPENWVTRRPLSRMTSNSTDIKARYPPRNMLNAKYKKGPREAYMWIPTVTYDEPPFPIISGTCSFRAMQRLSMYHRDPTRSVHVLDVLKAVFEDMGRTYRPDHCDIWLQSKATKPNEVAIQRYRRELKLYIKREKNCPANTLTVKQAFKRDPEVQSRLKQAMLEKGISLRDAKARNKTLSEMFQDAESTPGGLERYEYLVERDLERCARELREFRLVQRQFDEDHGLLPVSSRSENV